MRIVISGIPIDVQKKNIKNMHLQVKPPDGHVVISAPLSVDDKAIEAYARTQLGFIKRAIAQFQDQPRASKRQYVSGETMYIWGKQYFLVFKPDNQKNSFEIQNQNIVLSMSAKSTVKQRDAYVKEEYRKILKEEIEKRLPKWETQTGLKCDSWQTKYMVTKWGACSTDKKKLWFNLQLAQKPYACLDYIILHELTHLITRKHDATFIAHMDRHMPNWREIRKELNDSRLDYYEAQDESPLQKLIDQSRYDDIRDAAIAYIQEDHSGDTKRLSVIDMEIENVIHIEQPEDGVIAFDVIASCDVEMPSASRKEITLGYETVEEIVSKYICRKRPPNGVVTTYLFGYEVDNPSAEYMKYKVFDEPYSGAVNETYYTKNLKFAKNFFAENIRKLYEESGEGGLEAVNTLYKKLTQRLMFNLHEIDDDYDVFVAFETMNNRGKKLTNLELLKNRLIYLTTLYDDEVFDEKDKSALRKKINDAWKEVYYQLGRNKSVPLSDDDFLRAHWIIYFRYSRKRGDDYIKFLLSKFSSKGIFEKAPVLVETEAESVISDDVNDADDTEVPETEEQEIIEVSKLQPKEIEDYVNSLKDMAKYWYDTYFPFESVNLTPEEQKRVDRLNRIGIGHFRPLITAIISRRDISANSRVKIFEAIERFIFVAFRFCHCLRA